jgi:hypothetical protein
MVNISMTKKECFLKMVFRVNKTKNYTVISNYHLKDSNLSLKAKGLLSVMLSLPDDWDYSIKGLVYICVESEPVIKSTLKELQKFGYLVIDKLMPNQTKSGRIEYEYNIFECPQEMENQKVETKEVKKQKNEHKVIKKQEVQKQEVEKQPLEKQEVEIQGVEKQAVEFIGQLNTNIQNTKKQNTNNPTTNPSPLEVTPQTPLIDNTQTALLDNKTPKPKQSAKHIFEDFANGNAQLLQALKDFEESRNKNRSRMTDKAKALLISKLQQLSSNPNDWIIMLETAILNGWKSVYPISQNANAKPKNVNNSVNQNYDNSFQQVGEFKF